MKGFGENPFAVNQQVNFIINGIKTEGVGSIAWYLQMALVTQREYIAGFPPIEMPKVTIGKIQGFGMPN